MTPAQADEPSALRTLVRALAAHSARNRGALVTIGIALLLESGFGALIPVAFGHLIDVTIPRRDSHDLLLVLAVVGGGAIVVSLVGVLRDYLYAAAQSDLLLNLRVAMFQRLQRVSLDYFGRTHAGDILTRFSGDLATLDGALLGAAPWVLLPACDILIGTAVLFWLDWRLALPSMLIWPACLAGPRIFGRRATDAADERKDDESRTLTAVHESIAAQTTIRLFLVGPQFLRRFVERTERLAASSRRLGFASAMVERSAGIGINLLRVVVLGVGATMAFRGAISLGRLASFQAVFLVLSSGLSWISQYAPTLLQAGGSMRRVQELLDEEADPTTDDAQMPALPPLRERVALNDVMYRYPNGRVALHGVTLTVARGSRVAIVGSSGSGKSTLLGLLLRLTEPSSGDIRLDGHDVRTHSIRSLREQLAVVSQDSFLFAASLADNIRVGRPDATEDDIIAAARAAEIHDFITSLPAAYDTRVEEGGVRLSGGQRQRVAIARALVRQPALLLLDEATSALDAATESAVNATLRDMAAGKTVISVTHRLSSVADADRVFVMSNGALVEQGTHTELLALQGVYNNLWQKQHGFISGADARIEITPSRLRRIPLLSALDDGLLEELALQFVVERHPADTSLVQEGEAADKFYVLVRGRVRVTRTPAGGEVVELAMLDDGDYFGEIGLLHDVPRNATVTALTECICLVLDREHFRRIVARVPRLRDELLERVSARLSVTTPAPPRIVPE